MSRPEGLTAAAASGDRVSTLAALRDLLADEIERSESSRDVAALSRQLTMVMGEIAELAPPAEKKGTPLDELRERRAARGTAAKGPGRAKKSAV